MSFTGLTARAAAAMKPEVAEMAKTLAKASGPKVAAKDTTPNFKKS